MTDNPPILTHMQSLIQQWEADADDKALFLNCYMMMTSNMLAATEQQEFNDPAWSSLLLHRFADYYFVALQAYEQNPAASPKAWQRAHNAAADPSLAPIRKLLLGVNAHINYDLALVLDDLLHSEWDALDESQRHNRHGDYCHVNDIIGRTIDSVQDQIIEPAMPIMDLIDRFLGPIDEILISKLITHWRDRVWENAERLLTATDPQERAHLVAEIEQDALNIANIL